MGGRNQSAAAPWYLTVPLNGIGAGALKQEGFEHRFSQRFPRTVVQPRGTIVHDKARHSRCARSVPRLTKTGGSAYRQLSSQEHGDSPVEPVGMRGNLMQHAVPDCRAPLRRVRNGSLQPLAPFSFKAGRPMGGTHSRHRRQPERGCGISQMQLASRALAAMQAPRPPVAQAYLIPRSL
jgi:hypothetical protein